MKADLYPWLEPLWSRLLETRASDRLPHALLIVGKNGLGKRRFADVLAGSILCGETDARGMPCGDCASCRYFAAGTHPDFLRVEPEDTGKPIRIDAIRALLEWSVRTSQDGAGRVTVIEPADRMNRAAANSLLKTLEEPVPGSHLLLVSAHPALLPATVRSRCQTVSVRAPARQEAIDWLSGQDSEPWDLLLTLSQGSPLRALELARTDALTTRAHMFSRLEAVCLGAADPLAVAAEWADDTSQSLHWLASWLRDLVRLRFGAEADMLENPDLAAPLQVLVERLDLRFVLRTEERLQGGAQVWQRANLNAALQMEDLVTSLVEGRR